MSGLDPLFSKTYPTDNIDLEGTDCISVCSEDASFIISATAILKLGGIFEICNGTAEATGEPKVRGSNPLK